MAGEGFEAALGSGPLTVLTRLTVEPGKLAHFDALFSEYADCVRQYEPGCQHYSVVRAVGAERQAVLIIARFVSLEAYRAHVEAPHTVSVLSRLSPLIDGPPVLEVFVD